MKSTSPTPDAPFSGSRRSCLAPRPRGRGGASPCGSRAVRCAAPAAATPRCCRSTAARAWRLADVARSKSRRRPGCIGNRGDHAARRRTAGPRGRGRRAGAGGPRPRPERHGVHGLSSLEDARRCRTPPWPNCWPKRTSWWTGRTSANSRRSRRRWIGSANQRVHFLSGRCDADDPRWLLPNTLEIRLRGIELTVNGFPARSAVGLWKRPRVVRAEGASDSGR